MNTSTIHPDFTEIQKWELENRFAEYLNETYPAYHFPRMFGTDLTVSISPADILLYGDRTAYDNALYEYSLTLLEGEKIVVSNYNEDQVTYFTEES